jgi:hypothetical protein
MSHAAIAAVLELGDLSTPERLAALSLASYANPDHVAWPKTPLAAARAGLPKGVYVEARGALAARGLIIMQDPGGGRPRSSTITLQFASQGPWWDGAVNARLLDAVLEHSQARGAARLLLAALAAVADDDGTIDGLSTDELRAVAGLSDTTYRRARAALLASGELDLLEDGGGRGRMNRWRIAVAGCRDLDTRPVVARRLAAAGSRPWTARAGEAGSGAGPRSVGTSRETPPQTPPETPPETPPLYARAGSNALNLESQDPPDPPTGGPALAPRS